MEPLHTVFGYDPSFGTHRGVARAARLRHTAIFGATGVGKSTLLLNLIAQDLWRGDGVAVIDPHGPLVECALDLVPRTRHNHVCLLDFTDLEFPVGLNLVENVHRDDREALVDSTLAGMRAIWLEIGWGAQLEEILRHALMALIEAPNTSIVLLPRLLVDSEFRARILAHTRHPLTRSFFEQRFNTWNEKFLHERSQPVINKIDAFLFTAAVRNTLGQSPSTLDLDRMLQRPRVVLANLAKGRLGETSAHLMGALLISRFKAAAYKRSGAEDHDWHLYVDEAQNFKTEDLASLLQEARKFGVSVTVSTQHTAGLSNTVRAALIGNAGTLISFRIGPEDAEIVAPQFNRLHQHFAPAALQELGVGEAFIRVAGDDTHPIQTWSEPERTGNAETVRKQSRRHFGRSRSIVEQQILCALN